MKRPAHLLRGTFYLPLILALCVIPFALAQRVSIGRSVPTRGVRTPQLSTVQPSGYNVILNGGFETGDFNGWTIDGFNNPPVVTNTFSHSGTFSAFAGGDPPNAFCGSGAEPTGDSSFYQQFTVPAGSSALSFWHWGCGCTCVTFDFQDAYITDSNGNILRTIFHQADNTQHWFQETVDMTPYAGQTVRLKFLVHQDGFGDLTGMYVDDVQLTVPCIVTTGSITNSDPTQVDRVSRTGYHDPSSCGVLWLCETAAAGAIHYNAYTFTNTTGSTRCVTVTMNTPCTGDNSIFTVAYLGSFDPNNICTNYLADEGFSPAPENQFSFNLDDGQTVILVVSEVTSGGGCPSYTMSISGLCVGATPTPTPTPTSSPRPTPTPRARPTPAPRP